jgi:hypothetical protein
MIPLFIFWRNLWLRDLRLEVRRIRSWASRDCHGDVVLLDYAAPHKHLAMDVTIIGARTNSNCPVVGAPFPLPGTLAMEAQKAKVNIDLRTSSSTPPLARLTFSLLMTITPLLMRGLGLWGRLAQIMAVELVDRLVTLVTFWYFRSLDAIDSRHLLRS